MYEIQRNWRFKMKELGKRNDIFGIDFAIDTSISGRPKNFPNISKGSSVVCGYDQGLGERMIVCNNLEDMQTLYDSYARGSAIRICWYTVKDGDIAIIKVN